jgi:hypothetical protein
LVVNELLAHRQVGIQNVAAGEPAHVDNDGEIGAGFSERVFDVGPALPGFVAEVRRRGAVGEQPGSSGD